MRKTALIISLIFFGALLSQLIAQVVFDDNFENGKLDFYNINNDTVELPSNSHLHFRMTNATTQQLHFFIDQGASGYTHRYNHRMVFRYEGDTIWQQIDTAFVDASNFYHFFHNTSFIQDTVYVSYWYPWTYTNTEDYLSSISGNLHISDFGIRDTSFLGRNIYGYLVTDSTISNSLKKKVVIQNRQHSQESLGSIVSQGMSEYLIFSTDPIAKELRKRALFYFYPMLNPDGVVDGGNSVAQPDHNDEWFPSCSSQGGVLSTNFEIERMRNIIYNDCNGHVDFAFDIHSHPGHTGQYYWWSLVEPALQYNITQGMCDTSLLLLSRINYHDANDHGGTAIVSPTSNDFVGWASNLTAPPADWWFNQTMGAISYTLEPGSAPTRDYSRIKDVGVSIAKGLYDVLPPIIISSNEQLYETDSLIVYPNPTKGLIFVNSADVRRIDLYNVFGQKVDFIENSQTIDISDQTKGIYFLKIYTDTKDVLKRIVLN